MFLPEPTTISILVTLALGYGYEGYKWNHPKDPDPAIYYAYDPEFFQLGDEKACGDETNGPCTRPVKPAAATTSNINEGGAFGLGEDGEESAAVKPCTSCKKRES